MKTVATFSLGVFLGIVLLALGMRGSAQSQSLWIEDLTSDEVQAAIAAGKTTAIYYTSGIHENRAVVAVGKHYFLARHLAQRVAEQLGNALILPIDPYAPADPGGDPDKTDGHMKFAGTLSITDETYGNVAREVVTSAIVSAHFKNVVLTGDHGFGQESAKVRETGRESGQGDFDGGRLKKVAEELDAKWKSRGTRVFYIPLYADWEDEYRPYLAKKNVPRQRQNQVDDASEVMSIDPAGKWVRQDKIPPENRQIVSAELGKALTDIKVKLAVRHIRQLTSNR